MGNATSKKPGRENWVRDECVNNCHMCLDEFDISTWKHHCRACGNIFCADCCSEKIVYVPLARRDEPGYVAKTKRVCKACFQDILAERTSMPDVTPRECGGDAEAATPPPEAEVAAVPPLEAEVTEVPSPEDAAVDAAADVGSNVGGELRPEGVSAADPARDGTEDMVPGIDRMADIDKSDGKSLEPDDTDAIHSARSDSTSAGGNELGTDRVVEVDSSDGRASQLSDPDVTLDSTATGTMAADQGGSSDWEPKVGDIVVLGPGVPPRFQQRPAVVVEVWEGYCAVTVLDEARRFAAGACRPTFADMRPESRVLRPGTRVVVDGLQGAKSQRLNGLTGEIVSNPRMGHPLFVRTRAAPELNQLMTYVCLDCPPAGSDKSVLLEPRFLAPCDDGESP